MGRKAEILAWYPRLELLCLIIQLCLVTFKLSFHIASFTVISNERPNLHKEISVKRQELIWIFVCFTLSFFTADVWAALVPDTGQTKCYDVAGNVITCPSPGQALYGQDGNYTINPMSYTKLDGSGNALSDSATSWVMVKDNITGLVWEMKTNKDGVKNYEDPNDADNTYTWYDSNPATNGGNSGTYSNGTNTENFIKALNDAHYGGYSDWRMPTIKELASIVNYSIPLPGPTIDTGYFPNTAAYRYWSSTAFASSTNYAWCVDFGDSELFGQFKANGLSSRADYLTYARAIRGGQPGGLGDLVIGSFNAAGSAPLDDATASTGGYTDNSDGTVTDTATGLMWQQAGPTTKKTWEQALAYCEGLSLGGHTDWRLPTTKELQSLADYSRSSPAINKTYFPSTTASDDAFYWSGTTHAYYTYCAWFVDFRLGYVSGSNRTKNSHYVRAVRGGQPQPLDHLTISVSPASRAVAKDAGATTFSVSNIGVGTMPWTAAVTTGSSWFSITSGISGTNSGTINCSFKANTSLSSRTATIRVTAPGATGSPVDVAVTQAPKPQTDCTATLDENSSLHIPYITYGTLLLWADFVYEYNPMYPTLIPFKMVANAVTSSYLCEASTLSADLKIHIPDVLFLDRSNRLWMDLEYSPTLSTDGNTYFVVTKYGVVSN